MPATQGHSPNMTWCDQLFLTFDVHLLPQVYHCHAPKKTQTRVTFTELIGKLKEKIAEICVAKSVHQCFIIQKSYLFSVSDYPARTPSILIVDQVTSHWGCVIIPTNGACLRNKRTRKMLLCNKHTLN